MSSVRRAWTLALLAVAGCFADRPPALGTATDEPTTGTATTGVTSTGATTGETTGETGQGTTAGATTGEDCLPGMSPKPWYIDQDDDGWGVGDPVLACTRPAGHADQVGDCDDQIGAVNPESLELCNDLDDDCDGLLNEFSVINKKCGPCTLLEQGGVAWWLCVDSPPWEAARTACQQFGADLASVHGPEEDIWLVDQLTLIGVDTSAADTTVWLGMRRDDAVQYDCIASKNGWIWTDGSAVDFVDWGGPQPDNHPTADGCDDMCTPIGLADPTCPRENCLDLIGADPGWNDVPCHIAGTAFVCRGPSS